MYVSVQLRYISGYWVVVVHVTQDLLLCHVPLTSAPNDAHRMRYHIKSSPPYTPWGAVNSSANRELPISHSVTLLAELNRCFLYHSAILMSFIFCLSSLLFSPDFFISSSSV